MDFRQGIKFFRYIGSTLESRVVVQNQLSKDFVNAVELLQTGCPVQ